MEARGQRREEILAAALGIVSEGGVPALTVGALKERSGASVGSIYHHFGDRSGVVLALYRRCFDGCFAALRASMEAHRGGDAEAALRDLVSTYLGWVARHRVEARFIYETSGGDTLAGHTAEVFAFKGAFYAEVDAWLAPFVASGAIRALPRWAYDPVLMGAAHEFARRWLTGLPVPMDEAAPIIAEAVWRSVARP